MGISTVYLLMALLGGFAEGLLPWLPWVLHRRGLRRGKASVVGTVFVCLSVRLSQDMADCLRW